MKKEFKWLILFFIIALSFRLFFAFQSSTFTGDEAYFTLRQVTHISTEFSPIYHDDLSYGGRTRIFLPIFHYILAFFNLFLPLSLVGKLIPNIFASTLVFVIYLLSMQITKNNKISLFTSFISIFIPIYLIETINTVSVLSLLIPLFFLLVYFLLEIKKYSTLFILGCIFISLISPFAAILSISLIVYLLLARVEDLKINKARLESILFFIFIVIWLYSIIYKNAFLANGALVIWRNIPSNLLTFYFASTDIVQLMFLIGIVPFVCGIYAIYRYFFVEKNRAVIMFTALTLTLFVLLFFRLITPQNGALFLGVTLVILLSPCLDYFFNYLSNTKFSKKKWVFAMGIFIIFVFNSIIPSAVFADQNIKESIADEEIKALLWLKINTPNNATVLADITKGHLITGVADRKNVIDTHFVMIDDADIRYDDVNNIFDSTFQTVALSLLTKYDVDYIYTKNDIQYADEKCIVPVYDDKIKIYEVRCDLD